VFEWVTTELGAQGAVCAGGHYDGLVAEMGGQATPAVGFAIGLERLITLVSSNGNQITAVPDIYLVMCGDLAIDKGVVLAENLRDNLPDLKITMNCGGGDIGKQLKRADKSGAAIALIIGENEANSDTVVIKYLRESKEQEIIKLRDVIAHLAI